MGWIGDCMGWIGRSMGWIGGSMGTNGRRHGLFPAENGAVSGRKFTYFRTNCPTGGPSPGNGADKRGSAADRTWHARAPHGRPGGGKSQQCLTPAGPKRRRGARGTGFNVFPRRAGLSLFFRTLPRLRPCPRGCTARKGSGKNAGSGPAGCGPCVKKGVARGLLPGQTFAGAQKKHIFAELC